MPIHYDPTTGYRSGNKALMRDLEPWITWPMQWEAQQGKREYLTCATGFICCNWCTSSGSTADACAYSCMVPVVQVQNVARTRLEAAVRCQGTHRPCRLVLLAGNRSQHTRGHMLCTASRSSGFCQVTDRRRVETRAHESRTSLSFLPLPRSGQTARVCVSSRKKSSSDGQGMNSENLR